MPALMLDIALGQSGQTQTESRYPIELLPIYLFGDSDSFFRVLEKFFLESPESLVVTGVWD